MNKNTIISDISLIGAGRTISLYHNPDTNFGIVKDEDFNETWGTVENVAEFITIYTRLQLASEVDEDTFSIFHSKLHKLIRQVKKVEVIVSGLISPLEFQAALSRQCGTNGVMTIIDSNNSWRRSEIREWIMKNMIHNTFNNQMVEDLALMLSFLNQYKPEANIF